MSTVDIDEDYIVIDPKDAHVCVCACGKRFDWYAEQTEKYLARHTQTLKAELLAKIEQNLSDDDRGNDFIYKDKLVNILEEL